MILSKRWTSSSSTAWKLSIISGRFETEPVSIRPDFDGGMTNVYKNEYLQNFSAVPR